MSRTSKDTKDTCVYIHTRADGIVFYVGIGSMKRPFAITGRNKHWNNVITKYEYSVTIIQTDLFWNDACLLEIELIKKYRTISGTKLCNMTMGGDGCKGYSHRHTEETKRKLSLASKGKIVSDETKSKMSIARKNYIYTPEQKANMCIAQAGKVVSDETKLKMSNSAKGKSKSLEHRMKIGISGIGRIHTPESKAKISAARKATLAKKREINIKNSV